MCCSVTKIENVSGKGRNGFCSVGENVRFLGGPNLEMEIRPCNVRRDLHSLLQTLQRQATTEN